MRPTVAVNSKPALLETGKRGRTYPSGRREWPTTSGTRLVCLRSSSARVRGWIGSCLRKRPSMPCKCFATVKGFYFCSAQFCIIINFPLLLLRGREEPTAPSPPTMTSSSHKLVLFWMLRAELAPERSECNARLANSGKLTFLKNYLYLKNYLRRRTWLEPGNNLSWQCGETLVTREEVCRLWLLLSRRSHSGPNLLRWLAGTALWPDSLCPQRCRYGTTCFQVKVSPWTETGVQPKGP